jgi:hypothetical protein
MSQPRPKIRQRSIAWKVVPRQADTVVRPRTNEARRRRNLQIKLVGKAADPYFVKLVQQQRWPDLMLYLRAHRDYRDGTEVRTMLWHCRNERDRLDQRELDFIRGVERLVERRYPLSDKQRRWLEDIYARLTERC